MSKTAAKPSVAAHAYPALIETSDGMAIQPRAVAVIKRSPLDDEKSVVWIKGQSATDAGFLVDMEYEELLDAVQGALNPEEEG